MKINQGDLIFDHLENRLPLLYCVKHPQYQLNMICLAEQCDKKGPICSRCLLNDHYKQLHTLQSFLPLDEAISKITIYLNQKQQNVLQNRECKDNTAFIQATKLTISNQLDDLLATNTQNKSDLICKEQIEFQVIYNNCFLQTEPQNSIDEEPLITPTDDGSEILNNIEMQKLKNQKNCQTLMIQQLLEYSQQFVFSVEKSDFILKDDSLTKDIINRNITTNQNSCQRLLMNFTQQLKQVKCFYRSEFSFGMLQKTFTMPDLLGKGWKIIFQRQYKVKTSFFDLLTIRDSLAETNIICICALDTETDTIIIGGIDETKEIFARSESLTEARKSRKQLSNQIISKKLQPLLSFGFSDNSKISLQDADCELESGQRLSWNLNKDGGYRAGELLDLHKSSRYQKIILLWDQL